MRDVGRTQSLGDVAVDPALAGEGGEGRQGGALPEPLVAAADDELPGLGEELDLADAALPELEVVAGDGDRAGEALVGADAEPHVLGVLDRPEVEVPAPDEGPQPAEEGLAGGDRAGAGAGLDVGGALPGAAEALVVVLGRLGGDADRRHRRVGAQAQVGAEDVALGGDLGEQLHELLGDADEAAAQLGVVVGGVAGLVEQHDQVDVGRVVELEGAHLAHGEDEHAGGLGGVLGLDARQLAAVDLLGDERDEAEPYGAVGERGQGRGDPVEVPGAAEVGERDQERGAAAGDAQAVGEGGCAVGRHLGEDAGHRRLRRYLERRLEPVGLTRDQPGEEGRAAGRALEQRPHRLGLAAEAVADRRQLRCVVRARRPHDAVGERVVACPVRHCPSGGDHSGGAGRREAHRPVRSRSRACSSGESGGRAGSGAAALRRMKAKARPPPARSSRGPASQRAALRALNGGRSSTNSP